uniref:Uncharacterized protein n=1 Tax=Cucumis melo TaxID=3656 RepID=A0A9I9EBA8_CUCME
MFMQATLVSCLATERENLTGSLSWAYPFHPQLRICLAFLNRKENASRQSTCSNQAAASDLS